MLVVSIIKESILFSLNVNFSKRKSIEIKVSAVMKQRLVNEISITLRFSEK